MRLRAYRVARVQAARELVDPAVVAVDVAHHVPRLEATQLLAPPVTVDDVVEPGEPTARVLQREPEPPAERPDVAVHPIDVLATGLGVLPAPERIADRVHASADAFAGLEHRDVEAGSIQLVGRCQPGEARADDYHPVGPRPAPAE